MPPTSLKAQDKIIILGNWKNSFYFIVNRYWDVPRKNISITFYFSKQYFAIVCSLRNIYSHKEPQENLWRLNEKYEFPGLCEFRSFFYWKIALWKVFFIHKPMVKLIIIVITLQHKLLKKNWQRRRWTSTELWGKRKKNQD